MDWPKVGSRHYGCNRVGISQPLHSLLLFLGDLALAFGLEMLVDVMPPLAAQSVSTALPEAREEAKVPVQAHFQHMQHFVGDQLRGISQKDGRLCHSNFIDHLLNLVHNCRDRSWDHSREAIGEPKTYQRVGLEHMGPARVELLAFAANK